MITSLVLVLVAFVFGLTVGWYRESRYQNLGEALVSDAILQNFTAPDYHLLNHMTLPIHDGTTQINHILVSRYGVFVIETKDYTKGWIFAHPKQATWTQVIFKAKFSFQNPIFQNALHVRVVQNLLDFLPPEDVKSIVVFTGASEFRTEMPPGVFTLPQFVEHLRAHTTPVMSLNRMQFCVGRLETARFAISGKTDVEHVQNLERRHRRSGG